MPEADESTSTADVALGERPPVEIGWVLVGDFTAEAEAALDRARRLVADYLEPLGRFRFVLQIRRRAAPREHAVEPVHLIDIGSLELDAGHWDFSFAVTAAELRPHSKPFCLGAPASSLNVAALSTARLDPGPQQADRAVVFADRIAALCLHLFGHLNDLSHSDDSTSFMHAPDDEGDLDTMRVYSPGELERLDGELGREADERIEERRARVTALRFYLEATWDNRSDIYNAVMKIRPWLFFSSFSRLTTTAVSAMVILLITAEAWDMGVRQPFIRVVGASTVSIAFAAVYLLRRQRLLERRRDEALTEQRVIANVSVTIAALIGMVTTYALLFFGALAFTEILQPAVLIQDWVPRDLGPIGTSHYLTMCAFAATLGVMLGALGASFESETYFRHVVLIDEET